MEFEDRNPKPEAPNGGLPMAVLMVLVGIICLLLYAGWHLMSDDASKVSDLNKEEPIVQDSSQLSSDITASEPSLPEVISQKSDTENATVKKEEQVKKEEKPLVISGEKISHLVKDGETFNGIANKFNLTTSTLKKLNPTIEPNGLKVGVTKLTVLIQGYHVVGPGDILKVVAGKYNISVEALMTANNKTKNFAERGEKLIIPRKIKE